MGKIMDLTGKRFGRLKVIQLSHRSTAKFYRCICDCGQEIIVPTSNLNRGATKSCGCLRKELQGTQTLRHGQTKSKEHRSWANIKTRCTNVNYHQYHAYGARGIKMCERWMSSFENFLSDLGPAPTHKHSVGRIDNNGNYEPSNCRWETFIQQANNKTTNLYLTYRGETKTLMQWTRILNLPYPRTVTRLERGWSTKEAFERPALRTSWNKKIK